MSSVTQVTNSYLIDEKYIRSELGLHTSKQKLIFKPRTGGREVQKEILTRLNENKWLIQPSNHVFTLRRANILIFIYYSPPSLRYYSQFLHLLHEPFFLFTRRPTRYTGKKEDTPSLFYLRIFKRRSQKLIERQAISI